MRLILLLFVLVFIWPVCMHAQEADTLVFSEDSEQFFQELNTILVSTNSKDAIRRTETMMGRFYARWSIGRFNKAEKDALRKVVSRMREKRMRAHPELYNYLYTVTLLLESQQLPPSILAWQEFAYRLLEPKSSQEFQNFIEFTRQLLEEKLLNQKSATSWRYSREKFEFVVDTAFLVDFEKLDLTASTKRDSSLIENTKGVFYYGHALWKGQGGQVNWQRFQHLEALDVVVELPEYHIDMTGSEYAVDSALLNYKRFFKRPVLGVFSDRVFSSPASSNTLYPKFETYEKKYEVEQVFQNINFKGGYQIEGLKINGVGSADEAAEMTFYRNKELFATLKANRIMITPTSFQANDAQIHFTIGDDSLVHPDLMLRYQDNEKLLLGYSSLEKEKWSPFYDSYHKLEIYVEALYWKVATDEVRFDKMKGISSESQAVFTSFNYFSETDFYQLQGIDELHPMYQLARYLYENNTSNIDLASLSAFLKKPEEQVNYQLTLLSQEGYIMYDAKTGKGKTNDKFYFFLEAKAGASDYDVIKIKSKTNNMPNASLNLQTNDLLIFGVEEVFLSDSQRVFIYPYNQQLIMKKNRDFAFDGRVRAGLFDFYSRDGFFVYDSFLLKLNTIDTLKLLVQADTLDIYGNPMLARVQSSLADLRGTLLIDAPNNKSGLASLPEYPVFTSDDQSYVYYDAPAIQDSTLKREDFYFSVDPFSFDSLDNFIPDQLQFDGLLSSGGIFPPISQALVVRDDYSLGFTHETPAEGYPIYGGLGIYKQKIELDNRGFRGSGVLNYQGAEMVSEQLLFYPDSLLGLFLDVTIVERPDDPQLPPASADSIEVCWLVDTNLMTLNTLDRNMTLYHMASFNGIAELSPLGLFGKGDFNFGEARLFSKRMHLKHHQLYADTANLNFYTADEKQLLFQVEGYQSDIDFDLNSGVFYSNGIEGEIRLPFNQYLAQMDEVQWDMDANQLTLLNNQLANAYPLDSLSYNQIIDLDLKGSEFISTHPEQDSISFFSLKALYDMENYTLRAEKVKIIRVADAAVFPGNEVITIRENALMETLYDANLIINTQNKFHNIYNAEVNIYSNTNYLAKGFADYYDRNRIAQPVFFSTIATDSLGNSYGLATIDKNELFFLSPEFMFSGTIRFKSKQPGYYFNGGYNLSQDCYYPEESWMRIDAYLDPKDLQLPVPEKAKDIMGDPLVTGLMYNNRSRSFYPALLQKPDSYDDKPVFDMYGTIGYDTIDYAFELKNENQFPKMQFDLRNCIMTGSGDVYLIDSLPYVKTRTVGSFEHRIIPDSTYFTVMLLMDFFFNEKALEIMADSMMLSQSPVTNLSRGHYPEALQILMGQGNTEALIEEMSLYGSSKKMPDLLKRSLVINELRLRWNHNTQSFMSMGPIGVGSVAGQTINKYFDGYVEISKKPFGDEITLYLQPGRGEFYYFNYQNLIMQSMASNMEFNNLLLDTDYEKRLIDDKSEPGPYEYVISSRSKVLRFIRDMQQNQIQE